MVLVVPGPIGLYRRKAMQDVFEKDIRTASRSPSSAGKVPGPFSHETFAEDFQLSLTILALGGRIVYEPSAVSYTKSPDLTHTLLSQRYRHGIVEHCKCCGYICAVYGMSRDRESAVLI
jgi:poly-beta-1,6-N-acetyl-D-glucosamine synthase